MNEVTEDVVNALADRGCTAVIEGGYSTVTPGARKVLKKRGLWYGPHTLTLTGNVIQNHGYSFYQGVSGGGGGGSASSEKDMDAMLKEEESRIYQDVKTTAQEFNSRGDLFVGANIAGFLRVANAMLNHGAV